MKILPYTVVNPADIDMIVFSDHSCIHVFMAGLQFCKQKFLSWLAGILIKWLMPVVKFHD